MVRISKEPEERINEILNAAEKLFALNGYDKTTVSSIVNEVGVAKGTFYYYFDSKESIINAIIERRMNFARDEALRRIEEPGLNAIEKMERVMDLLINPSNQEKAIFPCDSSDIIVEVNATSDQVVHNLFDNNAKLHQKRDEVFHKIFKAIILDIVKEGIKDGLFNCEYYQDITEIVFIGIDGFMHINYEKFVDKNILYSKARAIEELLERVLGIEKGRLNIIRT